MLKNSIPCVANNYFAEQAELILSSFSRVLGTHLIDSQLGNVQRYQALYEAPFCVLSHNTNQDPVFNYGNESTLRLFEFDWQGFTNLPSRYSAEFLIQEERDRLLEQVKEKGFIDDYQGVRVSSSGKRFFVEKAIVWNVFDNHNIYQGQAAVLYQWSDL